jgi:hypothetical protein
VATRCYVTRCLPSLFHLVLLVSLHQGAWKRVSRLLVAPLLQTDAHLGSFRNPPAASAESAASHVEPPRLTSFSASGAASASELGVMSRVTSRGKTHRREGDRRQRKSRLRRPLPTFRPFRRC